MSKAGKASEETKKASIEEKRNLAMAEAATNLENTEFQGVIIPAGFAPTRIDGESTVEEGLVIIDSSGNEFVWIPCTLDQYQKAANAVIIHDWTRNNEYDENQNRSEWRDTYTNDDKQKLDKTYVDENSLPTDKWVSENQIEKAENSIINNGGFYIARYEAGVPEDAAFNVSNVENAYVDINKDQITKVNIADMQTARGGYSDTNYIKNLKPISKQGVQAWNYITQSNAKLVSENMYNGSKSVDSYLVDSQAWNHICLNIFNAQDGQESNNSKEWGNFKDNVTTNYNQLNCLWAQHSNSSGEWTVASKYNKGGIPNQNREYLELSTGASEDFKKYNIYDMAGNMLEWTTAHSYDSSNLSSSMFFVCRGGSFYNEGAYGVTYASGSLWLGWLRF